MRLNRLLGALATIAVCVTANAAAPITQKEEKVPEYVATVQQAYDAARAVRSVALAPFECPREVDCGDFQKEVLKELADRTELRVVDPKELQALMTQASVSNLQDYEGRMIIGEALSIDAFAFVTIQKVDTGVTAPSAKDPWKDLKKDASVKRAALELRIIARDGTDLVRVSGKAEVIDSFKGLSSISSRLFEVMLDRAWP